MHCTAELPADGREGSTQRRFPGHTALGSAEIPHTGAFPTLGWCLEHLKSQHPLVSSQPQLCLSHLRLTARASHRLGLLTLSF